METNFEIMEACFNNLELGKLIVLSENEAKDIYAGEHYEYIEGELILVKD
jgi:hypothetical protein